MGRVCAADLEADGLLDEATKMWCAVFKDIRTKEVFRFTNPTKAMSFMDTCQGVVMHNGVGYDWPLLRKLYGYEYEGSKIDTLLMSRLQQPNRFLPPGCTKGPHSIEAWGMRLGRYKPDHDDWSKFSPEMLHRCSEDVEILDLTLQALLSEGRGFDWKAAHKTTADLFEILQLQEQYGWLVDQPYMERCHKQLTGWINKIEQVVRPRLPFITIKAKHKKGVYDYYKAPYTKAGKYQAYVQRYIDDSQWGVTAGVISGPFSRVSFQRVDLGSGAQVKKYLLSEGWVPAVWNYNEDGERTSPKMNADDPFVGVSGKEPMAIVKFVTCRQRRSTIEGWQRDIRADGRVSQGIGGIAATGRLKHKRVVNVPGGKTFYGKQMRKIFTCKEGYKIVGVDADSCQLRMLAARMGDKQYMQAIIDGDKDKGTDIHSVNRDRAGLEYRADAKTFIYGFLFGAGDDKIGRITGGGAREGKALKAKFLAGLPLLKELIDRLTKEWRSNAKRRKGKWGTEYYNGWFIGLDGRPIRCSSEHMILVYCLQSDEAIMMQHAALLLYSWCKEKGWVHGREYGFVANMHDEIQTEVRIDIIPAFKVLAERSIAEAAEQLKIACPHEGGADVGDTWYATH